MLRTLSGAGTSVKIISDTEILHASKEIAEALNVLGCVCFEFIRSTDGRLYFMECNPRFSGGIAFSCEAGYDCVINHIRCYCNESIDGFDLSHELYIARKYIECITKS